MKRQQQRLSIREAVSEYLHYIHAQLAPATCQKKQYTLQYLIRFCESENLHLHELTRSNILSLLGTLRTANIAPWTQRSIANDVRTFLRYCEVEGYINANPMRTGDGIKQPEFAPQPLTRDDIARLLSVLNDRDWLTRRDRALILTLIHTGLRRAEILQMRASHAHDPRVVVRAKGGKMLETYINAECMHAIQSYLRAKKIQNGHELQSHDPLWWGEKGALTGSGIRQIFRKLSNKTGMRLWCHRMRHTSITLRLAAGASTELVRETIGHSTDHAIRHYAKLAEEDKQRLMDETSPLKLLPRK